MSASARAHSASSHGERASPRGRRRRPWAPSAPGRHARDLRGQHEPSGRHDARQRRERRRARAGQARARTAPRRCAPTAASGRVRLEEQRRRRDRDAHRPARAGPGRPSSASTIAANDGACDSETSEQRGVRFGERDDERPEDGTREREQDSGGRSVPPGRHTSPQARAKRERGTLSRRPVPRLERSPAIVFQLSRERVGGVVDAHQVLHRDVRVALRRRERRVAEQLLDRREGRRHRRACGSRRCAGARAGADRPAPRPPRRGPARACAPSAGTPGRRTSSERRAARSCVLRRGWTMRGRTSSQRRSASTQRRPRGTTRSLLPLPRTRALVAPGRSSASRSSPQSSLTRRPEP